MELTRSKAFLLAVLRIVDRLNEEDPKKQRNGGNVVRWPTVVTTLQYLQHTLPERIAWTDSSARKDEKKTRTWTQENRDAQAAGATFDGLEEIVQEIRRTGQRPNRPAPRIEGINFDPEPVRKTIEENTFKIAPSRSDKPDERVEERKAELLRQHDRKVAQALVEQAAVTDLLVDAVERGARTAPPIIWTPAPMVFVSPDADEEVPVILMGDIHGGTEIKPDEVGGLGEFNFQIFKRRLDTYLERIISKIEVHRRSAKIKKAVLNALGDMLEGDVIFDGQAHRIEMVTVDQLFEVAAYLVDWIQRLLATGLIDTLDIVAIFGNHGRTTHKKGATKAHANWDYVLYRYMAALLKTEPRVKWFIPKAWFAVYQLFEWRLYCTHGDTIKSWLGIPYYGIQRHDSRTTLLLQSVDLNYHYWICGDKHVTATIPRVQGAQIMNGSIVGGSDFSMHQLGTASEPMQTMFGISERHGKTWQYDFVLDRRDPEEIRKHLAFTQI